MSMTTGDELGKSDMFMKVAVSLFPGGRSRATGDDLERV